ncbi:hypothetical protein [Sporosarcina sp. P29]|uniref:hypothetical protein n=1 Tax=Sporosarcina sp. P29 TaxID=2048252 RepID=UPI000C172AC4|nr:hypothetical protein [Sporosarcina sp. P29]PIC98528.1 hypothetical protein CSV68_12685 [Sporosarcina sp. P29]
MLPIYIDNSEVKVFAREILASIIKNYFLMNEDFGNDYSDLFPEVIYNETKEKCDSAATDIYVWSRDGFERDLSPLHEHALYKILRLENDMEKDHFNQYGESLYFNDVPNYGYPVTEEEESSDFSISDIDMDFYLEYCFQDLDFYQLHDFINLALKTSVSHVNSEFHMDLNDYRDLIPRDIKRKLFETDFQDTSISPYDKKIVLQKNEAVYIMSQNNLNISHSSFGDNINILSDNVKQNKITKHNESIDKIFAGLSEFIVNSKISEEEKQQASYHAQELERALHVKDKCKAKLLHSFLLKSLGPISSLLTIGQFISEKL